MGAPTTIDLLADGTSLRLTQSADLPPIFRATNTTSTS
jgi:hypothetical protein